MINQKMDTKQTIKHFTFKLFLQSNQSLSRHKSRQSVFKRQFMRQAYKFIRFISTTILTEKGLNIF